MAYAILASLYAFIFALDINKLFKRCSFYNNKKPNSGKEPYEKLEIDGNNSIINDDVFMKNKVLMKKIDSEYIKMLKK